MNQNEPALFLDYTVRWRTGEVRPGKHASRHTGAGGNFRGCKPFWQLPDARQIDVRRSITDPYETLMVRQMENRGAITLMLAADFSASMRAEAAGAPFAAIANLVQAAARAAQRAGDGFGFIGFDSNIRNDFHLPPTRARGAAHDLARRLQAGPSAGPNANAVTELSFHLPQRRCLLLLLSDFLLPLRMIERALASLARHDVVPVVLHGRPPSALPGWGLLRLRDAEQGATRLVLMRPSLARRWAGARADWRAALDRMFAANGRPAFHAVGELDIAALGRHLTAE